MSQRDWSGLTRLVPLFRDEATQPHGNLSLHERAEVVATRTRGEAEVRAHRTLVNIAALAIASRGSPSTWLCRPSASALVHSTKLHSIPHSPPGILRSPGIVEVRRPETGERLWGDIVSLGWYTVPGEDQTPPRSADAIYLIGIQWPYGAVSARWEPDWTGGEIESRLPLLDPSPQIPNDLRRMHNEFARHSVCYLIALGLLAETNPSPLRIVVDKQALDRKVRHVYLAASA